MFYTKIMKKNIVEIIDKKALNFAQKQKHAKSFLFALIMSAVSRDKSIRFYVISKTNILCNQSYEIVISEREINGLRLASTFFFHLVWFDFGFRLQFHNAHAHTHTHN